MRANVPNLDDQEPEDLMIFWYHYQRGRHYREIFPDGGKLTKRATADLACYASNIATAKRCRLSGQIQTARLYETIAESIYAALPAWARW